MLVGMSPSMTPMTPCRCRCGCVNLLLPSRSFPLPRSRLPSTPIRHSYGTLSNLLNSSSLSFPVHSSRLLSSMGSSSSSVAAAVSQPQMAPSASDDAFEKIRAHQDAAPRLPPVVEARTMLNQSTRGMLSTLSQEHEGYPSGSMVDFACYEDGSPILAVSSLALHSKNLSGNAKCCLLVAKDPEDRTDTVITVYGDAITVAAEEREEVRAAYLKNIQMHFGFASNFLPRLLVDFGDFRFVQIKPRSIHYVSGVATARLGSGEFTAEEFRTAKVDPISQFSKPVTSHMNRDHSEDTKLIVQHSTSVKVDSAYMLDLDSLGFSVKAEYEGKTMKLRIPFPRPAQDRKDVKTLIVEMLQAAKSSAVPSS
ncbi:Root border cell-specific protein [Rhynchospora pubera]|uniref:Root border cell-specific protein n=1 Tax=Rhynchospora pubera TaxID=906938 RepID=A0AAV8F9F4_9POAL|nr:Root border cell-specific protein [Rhynchospora pubera]